MKFVITGATSFLGLELIDFLLRQGQEVVAVCRPDSKGLLQIPSGVTIVSAEMKDYGNLHRDILKADVLINLAWGGTGHDGRDVTEVQQENITCAKAAFFAADSMGCKLFVEAGSQAEYGSTTEVQTEDMECKPFSEYGKAKLKVKEELFKLSEQRKMKYIHLRIFSLIGEKDHPWTLVMSTIDKMQRNEPIDLSLCTQNWNFLYVKDAVKRIFELIKYAIHTNCFLHESFNVASRDTRRLSDFVKSIKNITCSKSVLKFGAISLEHIVSLQPDLTKLESAVGRMSDTPFEEVIERIIQKYSESLSCYSRQKSIRYKFMRR